MLIIIYYIPTDVRRQACNMPKWYMQMIKAYSHPKEGREHIYGIHIYMYERLGLGVYGPYICIYPEIEACLQSGANIYIYTCLNLGMQDQI